MKQLPQFIEWALSFDLRKMPIKVLKRPVAWRLPDIMTYQAPFGPFNVRFMQHDLGDDRPKLTVNDISQLVFADNVSTIPEQARKWLFIDGVSTTEEIRVRSLLWAATDLSPPSSDPSLTPHRYFMNRYALLVQMDKRLTFGAYNGRWGYWELPIEDIIALPTSAWTKSPAKTLRVAADRGLETDPVPWADVIYNYYNHYQPVPHYLYHMLAQLRLTHPNLLTFQDGQLTLKD